MRPIRTERGHLLIAMPLGVLGAANYTLHRVVYSVARAICSFNRALRVTGATRFKVLRFAVLPQVLPQYYAYLQYILERDIRIAAVLGIVGAGGIGTEPKGGWDIFDYGHVSTILLVIFLTVMLLEVLTLRLRAKPI